MTFYGLAYSVPILLSDGFQVFLSQLLNPLWVRTLTRRGREMGLLDVSVDGESQSTWAFLPVSP